MPSSKYTRVCKNCGDKSTVSYKPKGTELCIPCRGKILGGEMAKKRYQNYTPIRYVYFCPNCNSVRFKKSKAKSNLCGDCNRKFARKSKIKVWFDFETMSYLNNYKPKIKPPKVRHYRICPYCPEDDNTREVRDKSRGGIHPCKKHKFSVEGKRTYKPKKKYATKAEIEKQKEINRKHKESLEVKPKLKKQTKSDEELMAEWLAKNKPTVIDTKQDLSWSGTINLGDTI